MKKQTIYFLVAVFLTNILMTSCSSNNGDVNGSSYNESSNSSQSSSEAATELVDVESVSACQNYLKGKVFYGGNVKLEFLYDGNVSVYNNETNELVFTGHNEVMEKYGSASRRIKIEATTSNEAIRLTLGNDGKLMDETDFTIYKMSN
jgi:hypothetical protein